MPNPIFHAPVIGEAPQSRNHVLRALVHAALVAAIYALSRWDYLLFHTLIETLSVLVAIGIFVIAWNTRRISENRYLLTLSTGLLFVGMTSLLHMFTFKGMGVIPSASATANIATQLWIVSRLFMGVAFVAAGAALKYRVPFRATLGAFAVVWAAAIASILVFKDFPTMFVEGQGLTPLKIALEYVAIGMYGVGGVLLWRRRSALERSTASRLLVAIGLMIAAELAFTLYSDVYGVLNALGHLFVLGSSILIYFALIEATLTKPYESLFRELHRREQEEARIAGVLQTALACTPQRVQGVEVASTYRSATTGALIGGDFLDVWSPEPGVVAFVVGDVCGKGIDAAVTNATVRTTLRSYAHEDWRPETVLRRTNVALRTQLPPDKFVTLCYGTIEVSTGHLSLVNAGHPDPVLRRTDGRVEVLEARRHPPLGVIDDDVIEVLHADMDACDVLVIMTDGVIEAGWRRGAFGIEGAVRALGLTHATTSDAIAQALEDAAVQHAGAELSDDVSILAMRYEPDACEVEWSDAEGAA